MALEKTEEIKKPFLDNSTLAFIFINLTRFYMRETRGARYKEKFTNMVLTSVKAVNKMYREAFNLLPGIHKEAIEEVSVYYFHIVGLANQAEDMDGMEKAMKEYLKTEKKYKA